MNWIYENYTWLLPLVLGVLELVLRYVPTNNNLSILDKIYNVLLYIYDLLVKVFPKNKAKIGGSPIGSYGKVYKLKRYAEVVAKK